MVCNGRICMYFQVCPFIVAHFNKKRDRKGDNILKVYFSSEEIESPFDQIVSNYGSYYLKSLTVE